MDKTFQKDHNIQACPWCSNLVQLIDGCNVIKCKCQNDYCQICGGREIFSHRCINGCFLFNNQMPEKKIPKLMKRECTPEELLIFDQILQKYLENTKEEREIVQKQFLTNKDDLAFKVHLNKIMREIRILDGERIKEERKITGNKDDQNNFVLRFEQGQVHR